MINMQIKQPTREELEKMYPGYTLTNFQIKTDETYGGVYINVTMRRMVKNRSV